MNSLLTRLSLALLLVMVTVGGGFYLLERWSSERFHEELTQRLNASIAMYVTDQTRLMQEGEINQPELARLAERAMVINPSAEVYLLDSLGTVVGHSFQPDSVVDPHVDLGPLQRLIAGESDLPVYGSDPRNPDRKKVFSAAEVVDSGELQGYLYVVLGGRRYDELVGALRGSYARRASILATAALVLGGFLAGLVVFALMTRRLTRLTQAVEDISALPAERAAEATALAKLRPGSGKGDEISKLTQAFAAMAEQIRHQFEALQENDRLRRELITNVSHDLRTPLATLHGYVDTLLLKNRELKSEDRERYLCITQKHTRRLGELIDNLFELSKLDSGNMPLSLETFSLLELLQDVIQDFELEAKRSGVELQLRGSPERAMVHADIGLVQRVIENLIRNALHYTPTGGRIVIRASAVSEDDVAVSVSDTGCGIPESQLDNIFERYFRTESADVPRGQSSGLGLAIVKRILDLHGSRITVSSVVDEGTRFEFSLPIAAAA